MAFADEACRVVVRLAPAVTVQLFQASGKDCVVHCHILAWRR
jgi:hypothetical protein